MSSVVLIVKRLQRTVFVVAGIVALANCASPPPKNYGRKMPREVQRQLGRLAPSGIEDTLATPPHRMSRSDYPFDPSGNYREDWVQGSRSSGIVASTGSSSRSGGSERRFHMVKEGDTLFGLSRRYDVSLYDLRRVNSLSNYTIRKGQVLRIP